MDPTFPTANPRFSQRDRGFAGEDERGLICDWNEIGASAGRPTMEIADETLRDGLQSPSVRDPGIEDKIALLHGMVGLGIDCAATDTVHGSGPPPASVTRPVITPPLAIVIVTLSPAR